MGYENHNTAHGRTRKPQYRIKIYPNTETAVTNGKKLPLSRLQIRLFNGDVYVSLDKKVNVFDHIKN